MKYTNRQFIKTISWFSLFLILSLGLFMTPGCKKDTNTQPENQVLVSYKDIATYPIATVKLLLGLMQDLAPEVATIIQNSAYDVEVYKITYKTTIKGESMLASGLVCMPLSGKTFPIISFQNGTNTLKSNCPSLSPADYYYSLIEYMAGNGYIITIPDYIGFGASAQLLHPYYDRESSDRAVIDMILACHELLGQPDIKAKSSGVHYLMGYSQGGWATLSALSNLEANYKTTIPVKATSCGAGAYDMMAMSNYVLQQQDFPGPLYLPYFIYSQKLFGAHSDPLTKFFNEPYATRIPTLFDGTYSNDQVNAQLTNSIPSLLISNMLTNFSNGADFSQLRSLLVKNSVTAWTPTSKINFYHGTADLNVPPVQSQLIYNSFVNLGVGADKIQLINLPGTDHGSSLIPWGLRTIVWFNSMN